jgi:hypothetical protein
VFFSPCFVAGRGANSDSSPVLGCDSSRKRQRKLPGGPERPEEISNCFFTDTEGTSDAASSFESSGGGSYEPPTDFRTDATLEASDSNTPLLHSLFPHSSVHGGISGADGKEFGQKSALKSRKPWLSGEVRGKHVYKIGNKLG